METRKINTEFEIRSIPGESRAFEENGKRYIEGYASVFEQKSKFINDFWGGYYEIIKTGAFDDVLREQNIDVIYTPNHNYDQVIARTVSGTLKLEVDSKGLKYRAEIPNISYANDIYESVKRGDIYESSFTFMVDSDGQNWTTDESGVDMREIKRVKNLKEVASVTWGAYANTEVEARGHREYSESKSEKNPVEQKPEIPLDIMKRKTYLNSLKK